MICVVAQARFSVTDINNQFYLGINRHIWSLDASLCSSRNTCPTMSILHLRVDRLYIVAYAIKSNA
jgi:hypothetical protein